LTSLKKESGKPGLMQACYSYIPAFKYCLISLFHVIYQNLPTNTNLRNISSYYFHLFLRWTNLQGRTEVRWRPGQEVSLAPACSNLFGGKCSAGLTIVANAAIATGPTLLGSRSLL